MFAALLAFLFAHDPQETVPDTSTIEWDCPWRCFQLMSNETTLMLVVLCCRAGNGSVHGGLLHACAVGNETMLGR